MASGTIIGVGFLHLLSYEADKLCQLNLLGDGIGSLLLSNYLCWLLKVVDNVLCDTFIENYLLCLREQSSPTKGSTNVWMMQRRLYRIEIGVIYPVLTV